ncbi:23S rRNA (adenine(2503)-C(2))-methyltransferase RlmN [Oceanivirga salmonicida]|uniref:23S rRNA (adenine(2503)-C(2))-methyltransferase RlmN n=1 Tax=Oceanivirga salmonicida TaxID=1769291 RepID=UPI00083646F4|nr:23S rRNA (adenine(2503)-C(2))-methyltransferase RlmN [Oceanivirga salmonicida]
MENIKKIDLIDASIEDIEKVVVNELGLKKYVAKQIFDFVHNKLEFDFNNFTNIKKEIREKLGDYFYFPNLKCINTLESEDGETKKFLFSLDSKMLLETVLLMHDNRKTLCVSSQVGCPLKCDFCATGTMKFEKNLTSSEIVMQFYYIQKELQKKEEKISNLVYMGMGEPFLNYDNVIKSINILNYDKGQNISKRNFTISTSGLVKEIVKLANDEKQVHLAISLHSTKQEIRDIIMPTNKRYDLQKLKEALLEYQKITNNRITFEYILIDELNIDRSSANSLIAYLKPFNAHVNLIPYNLVEGKPYKTPTYKARREFLSFLKMAKVNVTLRETKGEDIKAACGQLKVKKEKEINEENN